MESFYGGRPGAPFKIVKRFDYITTVPEDAKGIKAYVVVSGEKIYVDETNYEKYATEPLLYEESDDIVLESMIECFKKGSESISEVAYGDYVIIDTVLKRNNRSHKDNGKIYRRGTDYTNDMGGAIYIGQIVGPAVTASAQVKIVDDETIEEYSYVAQDSTINAGAEKNYAQIKYANIEDEFGDLSEVALNFQFNLKGWLSNWDYDSETGEVIITNYDDTEITGSLLGSSSSFGVVKLSDDYLSSDPESAEDSIAATPKAVSDAYSILNTKFNNLTVDYVRTSSVSDTITTDEASQVLIPTIGAVTTYFVSPENVVYVDTDDINGAEALQLKVKNDGTETKVFPYTYANYVYYDADGGTVKSLLDYHSQQIWNLGRPQVKGITIVKELDETEDGIGGLLYLIPDPDAGEHMFRSRYFYDVSTSERGWKPTGIPSVEIDLTDYIDDYVRNTIGTATTESAGLLSPEDKAKLDAISIIISSDEE